MVAATGAVEQSGDRLADLAPDHRGVDVAALCFGQNLGLTCFDAGLRGHDTDTGVAVGVHEPQRDDSVEPGVGDPVGDRRFTLIAAARRADRHLQGRDRGRLLDPHG
jgi:hypothetical protein